MIEHPLEVPSNATSIASPSTRFIAKVPGGRLERVHGNAPHAPLLHRYPGEVSDVPWMAIEKTLPVVGVAGGESCGDTSRPKMRGLDRRVGHGGMGVEGDVALEEPLTGERLEPVGAGIEEPHRRRDQSPPTGRNGPLAAKNCPEQPQPP